MLLASVVSLVGLAAVLFAVYADSTLAPPGPHMPDWDALPTPADVSRSEFPLAFPGYDPASVEVHLDLLRRAYADLYAVAPAEVRERARQRAAYRVGEVAPEAVAPAGASAGEEAEAEVTGRQEPGTGQVDVVAGTSPAHPTDRPRGADPELP
jgi:DivIVA domain-containing protein